MVLSEMYVLYYYYNCDMDSLTTSPWELLHLIIVTLEEHILPTLKFHKIC